MGILLLFILWVLTFVLGRIRQLGKLRLSRFIPSMVFFRVALTAALLSQLLGDFGLEGDLLNWIAVVAKTGLYVALVELVLDVIWALVIRLNQRGVAPPRILKDLALAGAAFVVVAAELRTQGLLTTVGSAAVLGGLAFIVGPGSATQIGNISSALAVQVERQFCVGDWVEIAGELGRVDNISWNSTYLYDDIEDRYIVIPNSLIDQAKTINYSRPSSSAYRLEVEVGMPLDMPPGRAANLLLGVMSGHAEIIAHEKNAIVINSVDKDSMNYIMKFFIADFALRNKVRTEIFSSVWYALSRSGYMFPHSIVDLRTSRSKVQMQSEKQSKLEGTCISYLRGIELFESLSDDQIREIVNNDPVVDFGPGEMIVRTGDVGGSMYVILEGRCSVLIDDPSGSQDVIEVAELRDGAIFGEISALTNSARTASVKAVAHVMVQEISQRQIENIFLVNQAAMEQFANVMATREAALKAFSPEQKQSFELGLMARMKQTFSRLMSS